MKEKVKCLGTHFSLILNGETKSSVTVVVLELKSENALEETRSYNLFVIATIEKQLFAFPFIPDFSFFKFEILNRNLGHISSCSSYVFCFILAFNYSLTNSNNNNNADNAEQYFNCHLDVGIQIVWLWLGTHDNNKMINNKGLLVAVTRRQSRWKCGGFEEFFYILNTTNLSKYFGVHIGRPSVLVYERYFEIQHDKNYYLETVLRLLRFILVSYRTNLLTLNYQQFRGVCTCIVKSFSKLSTFCYEKLSCN